MSLLRWVLRHLGLALRADLLEQRHHWRDEYNQKVYYREAYRDVLAIHNQSVLNQEIT